MQFINFKKDISRNTSLIGMKAMGNKNGTEDVR